MRDGVTKQCRLSLAGCKPRISSSALQYIHTYAITFINVTFRKIYIQLGWMHVYLTCKCDMNRIWLTGNHYKWDWPKSQFCMLNILATIDWLRNLKVANIYFFNILQNTLKIFSFSKLEIRKLENLIFPSSAEPCRILQNSALVPQNSAEHFGEKLRNSADFCRILQNSAE